MIWTKFRRLVFRVKTYASKQLLGCLIVVVLSVPRHVSVAENFGISSAVNCCIIS